MSIRNLLSAQRLHHPIAMMIGAAAVVGSVRAAVAAQQPSVTVTLNSPTFDRWNYPFAGNAGANPYAAVFAPLTEAGFDPSFDNRDGQMHIGFRTSSQLTAGLGVGRYKVISATVFLTVESHQTFRYDPTPDSFRTWLPSNDPEFIADADLGHAVELFGTSYRHGYDPLAGNVENAPFSPLGSFGKGVRTAYPLAFRNGSGVDVSNNVDERFDPIPFAVGMNATLKQGQLVAAGTVLRFDLAVADHDVQRYLRRAVNSGLVDLTVASIFPSQVQTSGTYPRFYTKENLLVMAGLADAAKLEMVVQILDSPANIGDVNGDGVVNVNDLLSVISAWGPCNFCAADVNGDGVVNVNDLLAVISSWG